MIGCVIYQTVVGEDNAFGTAAVFMKGIDHSYYYEDYTTFKTEEL